MLRTMSQGGDQWALRVVVGAAVMVALAVIVVVASLVCCPMINSSDTCNTMPTCGTGKVDGLHWGCEAQWPASLKPWRWW